MTTPTEFRSGGKRERLIAQHLPLVRRLARRLRARLPANVELDELISAGVMGLLDAVDNFDPERETHFAAYASLRIRGAMLDELRRLDWVPRSVREKARRLEEARQACRERLGRAPSQAELADALDLPEDQLLSFTEEARPGGMYGYEDVRHARGTDGPSFIESVADEQPDDLDAHLERNDSKALILQAIRDIDERQRVVLGLYYVEGLTLREIGEILGVTESRISQLRALGLETVRPTLERWLAPYNPHRH